MIERTVRNELFRQRDVGHSGIKMANGDSLEEWDYQMNYHTGIGNTGGSRTLNLKVCQYMGCQLFYGSAFLAARNARTVRTVWLYE